VRKQLLERIANPQDTFDRIAEMVSPRSSLIISDEALSSETGKGTEFVVVMSDEPQGGLKHRRPYPRIYYGRSADDQDNGVNKVDREAARWSQLCTASVLVSASVEKGFAAAINQPAGNMTGITDLEPSLGGKWVQLLKQIAPATVRVGIVYNPSEGTISAPLLQGIKESAGRIAVTVQDLPITTEDKIENVISAFATEPNGGLVSIRHIHSGSSWPNYRGDERPSDTCGFSTPLLCGRWRPRRI
jgi:hypothetical protein